MKTVKYGDNVVVVSYNKRTKLFSFVVNNVPVMSLSEYFFTVLGSKFWIQQVVSVYEVTYNRYLKNHGHA